MEQKKKLSPLALVAAILFFLVAVFYLISLFTRSGALIIILSLLFLSGFVLMGIMLIMGKHDLILLIASLVTATASFIDFCASFGSFLSFLTGFLELSAAVFFALLVFGVFKPGTGLARFAAKVWFLAAILQLTAAIIGLIANIITLVSFPFLPGGVIFSLLGYPFFSVALAVAFFLASKALKAEALAPAPARPQKAPQMNQQMPPQPMPPQGYAPAPQQPVPPQGYAPAPQQAPVPPQAPVQPPQGYAPMPPEVAAQLQSLQAAVQSGAMSMEEYEARRRQLLGMPPVPPRQVPPQMNQQVPPQG